jgi:hypothetical protein
MAISNGISDSGNLGTRPRLIKLKFGKMIAHAQCIFTHIHKKIPQGIAGGIVAGGRSGRLAE